MRKILAILLLPLGEFLFLRLFLHSGLDLRIGYVGMTDYDWIFPSVIAFFLLMHALQRTSAVILQLQRKTLILNSILFVAFIFLSAHYEELVALAGYGFKTIWFLTAVATILSSAFVWISPKYFLQHSERILLVPFSMICLSKIVGRHVFSFLWQPIADLTGFLSYRLAHLLNPSVTQKIWISSVGERFTQLKHPLFTIGIGIGCGGMEGVFFLLFTLMLFYFMDHKKFTPMQWSLIAAIGTLYMYGLNVIRIAAFYLVSLGIFNIAGHHSGIQAAVALFHNSIGWVIYSIGLVVFYRFMEAFAAMEERTLAKRSVTH